MKAKLTVVGNLVIIPENEIESYALKNWSDNYDKEGNDNTSYPSTLMIQELKPKKVKNKNKGENKNGKS